MARSRRLISCTIVTVTLAISFDSLSAQQLVANGTFSEWTGPLPAKWSTSVGARNGAGPESTIRPLKDGGLSLEGNAATRVWRLLSQPITIVPGAYYRVRFTARAIDLKREASQYDNCYVALASRDAQGNRVGLSMASIANPEFIENAFVVQTPPQAQSAELWIFLSKTGRLDVRSAAVEPLQPEQSYDVLVDAMGRNYSYFAHRKTDWPKLVSEYRARAIAARTADPFIAVIREMLGKLNDQHIWIDRPNGERITTHSPDVPSNYDYRAVAAKLTDVRQIGKIGFTGTTSDGFGFVAIGSLVGDDALFKELESAIEPLLSRPGLIVDLRANGGGNELRAQSIAAMFADSDRIYARSMSRSGPAPTDLVEGTPRSIRPRAQKTFTRPIVCLIGPRCMSSGEGFAKMMRVLPHATLVGQPTRGSSGNPEPVSLPNGVTVYFSRWVDMLPDGTITEGKGVVPDVVVEHVGAGDGTFDRAVEELKRRVTARGE